MWSVYVAKFIDGTEKDGASLVERWIDETGNPMTERKIAQVMISICKWDNHQPVNEIQIDDLKFWKVNKVPSNTQPYIFDTGDKIVIDTEKSLVTINGKNAINIKEFFSNFPVVIRGENRIDIMPPDVNATISYREIQMRTPSGILHVVDFKTDQIISAIQPKDYWDDIRHWEIKNNIDTLEFKTFDGTSHAITLQQQNLIVKEVRDGRIIPYVINNEVEKDSNDKSIIVHASGAWVQIAKDGYIMPQRIESKTVNEFIDMALVGGKWKRGITEYAGFHTMTIDEIIDPLTFLKKIASLFDLEIQYRVEVVGSRITGWYVDMIKKRGRETGKEVTLGKDLVGVRRIEHSRDICTALVGFVKGEGDNIITVESINKGFLILQIVMHSNVGMNMENINLVFIHQKQKIKI